jgi:pilus assembly protein CpaF
VGEEAYPFIRASCTGHRVLGTIHADSAKDAIPRLVSMALCGSRSESEKSLKTAAATGIDIVVHIKAFKVIEILKISQCDEGCARQHAIYERGAK